MKKIKTMGCGLAAAALLAASAAQATTFPISYNVNVRTSFGSKFADCFSFDGAGNMTTVSGLQLTYALKGLGTQSSGFGAVTTLANATALNFELTFTGAINKATTRIFGNDELGDSYIISGKATASCGAHKHVTGAAYRHP